MSLTTGVGSFTTGFNLAYRYIDGYPTFVGSNAGLTNTAPMPSHQAHDLIVVFALNFDNDTIPSAPANVGGLMRTHRAVVAFTRRVGGSYKYAKGNTETVGNWFTADRILVAVYRNARALVGQATEEILTNSSLSAIGSRQLNHRQRWNRLLHFGISYGDNDAGSTPTGLSTRISTADISGAVAPSATIHDQEVDPASSYPSFTNGVTTVSKTIGITLGIGYGTPPLTAETTNFGTTLNGDVLPEPYFCQAGLQRRAAVLTSYKASSAAMAEPLL